MWTIFIHNKYTNNPSATLKFHCYRVDSMHFPSVHMYVYRKHNPLYKRQAAHPHTYHCHSFYSTFFRVFVAVVSFDVKKSHRNVGTLRGEWWLVRESNDLTLEHQKGDVNHLILNLHVSNFSNRRNCC